MEGLGRLAEALTFYRAAAESPDRPAAARGRLREIALRQSIGEMKREDAIPALETLTTGWRGDETEAEALQLLGRLYAEESRYRDAFQVMRTALIAHPQFRNDAAHPGRGGRRRSNRCSSAARATRMPPIDALGLFYDFRELTPIGRRGDEMIRRLADRLVSVDLLDQAAELLQHQVDNRLQGAARAQVAARLAVIYLMNRKPDRALAGAARDAAAPNCPNELRNQRLLLEARALSDIGRHGAGARSDRQHARPRGDPAARRHPVGGAALARGGRADREALRRALAASLTPLTDTERADVLRAAIGYALAEDAIGLDRFREKYAAKMADGPDRRAFEVVTAPFSTQRAGVPRRRARWSRRRHARRLPARHARALSGDDAAPAATRPAQPGGAAEPVLRPNEAAELHVERFARRSRAKRGRAAQSTSRSSAPGCPRPGSSRRPARRRSA